MLRQPPELYGVLQQYTVRILPHVWTRNRESEIYESDPENSIDLISKILSALWSRAALFGPGIVSHPETVLCPEIFLPSDHVVIDQILKRLLHGLFQWPVGDAQLLAALAVVRFEGKIDIVANIRSRHCLVH